MRKIFASMACAALLAGGAAQAESPKGEAELQKMLEGRVAGEPVDCINLRSVSSSRIINDTAIVYRSGKTLYVNRPRNGADDLSNWDAMVTKLHSNRLCRIDTVRMVDPGSKMMTGLVFLGEFVPYRKVN